MVSRPNYQFYQERVDLANTLESQLNSLSNDPVANVKIESSVIEIGIGLLIGIVIGGLILHH